ncbi:MAG: hypothetical protein ABI151_17980 [Chitinophagaceae bacterium]
MARTTYRPGVFLLGTLLTAFSISSADSYAQVRDTVVSSQKDAFEKGIQQMNKAMDKLDRQLDDKKWQLEIDDKMNAAMQKEDYGKMEADFQRAMEHVNLESVKQDVQKQLQESFSQADMEKIRRQVIEALSQVDLQKLKADASKAIASVNWDDVKKQLSTAMDKINSDIDFDKIKSELAVAGREARRELERSKKEDFARMKEKMSKLREESKKNQFEFESQKLHINKHIEKAKTDIGKARAKLVAYKSMTEEMESDQLLKRAEDFTIEYKGGELFINGEKQKTGVTKKYKKYFERENVIIKKEKDNLMIR